MALDFALFFLLEEALCNYLCSILITANSGHFIESSVDQILQYLKPPFPSFLNNFFLSLKTFTEILKKGNIH